MYFSLNERFYELVECHTEYFNPNRPKVLPVSKNDRYYRYLNNEIHEWMIYYNIKYDLSYEYIGNDDLWFLDISDDRDAMFVKLTWL